MGGGLLVQRERYRSHPLGERTVYDQLRSALEVDVLVVSLLRLGGRGEQRLGKAIGLAQATGKLDPAHRPSALVVLPAGAAQVAAHDALNEQRLGFLHQHGAARQLFAIDVKRSREIGGAKNMVGNDVFQQIEPEERKLRKDFSLVGNGSGHYDIEGGEAVSGNDEEFVSSIVDVAHFAASGGSDFRKIGFSYDAHCRRG